MIHFLKNRKEGGASSGSSDVIRRRPDEDEDPSEMLDAIVDDMLDAFRLKNKRLLKATLEALMELVLGKKKK